MGKCFAFANRACRIQFFEDDPVVLTLFVGDELDKRIFKASAMIKDENKNKDKDETHNESAEERFSKYRSALAEIITEEKVDAILARAEFSDSIAVMEIWQYVMNCVREHTVKNLTASAR